MVRSSYSKDLINLESLHMVIKYKFPVVVTSAELQLI